MIKYGRILCGSQDIVIKIDSIEYWHYLTQSWLSVTPSNPFYQWNFIRPHDSIKGTMKISNKKIYGHHYYIGEVMYQTSSN